MYKIIKNPVDLSREGIEQFCSAFRTNNYEIVTTIPSDDNVPELLASQHSGKSYQIILDDPGAEYEFFSIKYKTADNEEMLLPIGVYGISNDKKIRFPLIITRLWQSFLMVSKANFRYMIEVEEGEDHDFYYSRMLELREDFMRNVFRYYYTIDTEFCSAMSWPIRSERSTTRLVAESLNFHRLDYGKMEVYTSVKISPAISEYIKNCIYRWSIAIEAGSQEEPRALPNLKLFVRGLVNYKNAIEEIS